MDHKLEFLLLLLEDSRSWPFVERRVFLKNLHLSFVVTGISFERKIFDELYGIQYQYKISCRFYSRQFEFKVVFPTTIAWSFASRDKNLAHDVDCGMVTILPAIWILRAMNFSNIDETKSIDYVTTREPNLLYPQLS